MGTSIDFLQAVFIYGTDQGYIKTFLAVTTFCVVNIGSITVAHMYSLLC